jgi:hypothetical protein
VPYLGAALLPVTALERGGVRQFRRPEGPAPADAQRYVLQRMAEAEEELPDLLQRIQRCAAAADPLMLYSRLQVLDAIRRASSPGAIGFGSDALLEFYGGLVTAMPVELVLERNGAGYHPQRLYDLDRLLREYGTAANLAHQAKVIRDGATGTLDSVRHLLELENLFDRMLGYPAQLRPIFEAIVAPLADQARAVLGYALGDALVAADVYEAVLVERMAAVQEELGSTLAQLPRPSGPDMLVQYAAAHAAGLATFGAASVEEDLPGLLAERTGVPRRQLAGLVASLTTPLGSQPSLRSLSDANSLRRRPIVGLPGGRCLWVRPGDFIHGALDWAADACQTDPNLIKRFDQQRQHACERLAYETLASVFGSGRVHANPTYPAGKQRPDIDVLVALPRAGMVMEAKGGRFTDPARRGAPERVKTKSREFVGKALAQNARSITYLQSGAGDLRDRQRRPLALPQAGHVVSVIVTLDRVDPFATHLPDGGKRASPPPEHGTWLVNLADLLLVADVLRHPAEFYAYAQTRAAINQLGGPRIFVEADALGAWCEHRIRPAKPRPGELILLDRTSEAMNEYYAKAPDSVPLRPATHVPAEVLHALDQVLDHRPDHWHGLTMATLAVPPKQWRRIQKVIAHGASKPAAKGTPRRTRKLARHAATGLRLSPSLTVYLQGPGAAPVDMHDPTGLVIVSRAPCSSY